MGMPHPNDTSLGSKEKRQQMTECYLSSNDESPDSHRTPEPSDDESKSSTSSEDGQCNKENYHVDTGKIPQKKRKVGVAQKSASRQKNSENKKPSHSAKHEPHSLLATSR